MPARKAVTGTSQGRQEARSNGGGGHGSIVHRKLSSTAADTRCRSNEREKLSTETPSRKAALGVWIPYAELAAKIRNQDPCLVLL